MSRKIIGIDAPEGFETQETSAAKDEVGELIREWAGETFVVPDDFDTIGIADTIVSQIIDFGWRPTEEAR